MQPALVSEIQPSDEKDRRRELARQTANLFVVAERRGLEQQQLEDFGQILCTLLDAMDHGDKMALSSVVAAASDAPRDLAVKLAYDELEIAAPVIENSPALTDEDLVALANDKGTEHRVAMARRPSLSFEVTDCLISHEEPEVMRTVAQNLSAEISEESYATLVRHSAEDDELLKAFAERVDFPKALIGDLPKFVDKAHMAMIKTIIANSTEENLHHFSEEAKTGIINRRIERSSQKITGKYYIKQVADGHLTLDEAATALAHDHKPNALAVLLAASLRIPDSKVLGAIVNTSNDLLVMICRTLELHFETFIEIDQLRLQTVKLGTEQRLKPLLVKYEGLDIEQARKTMRFVNLFVNTENAPPQS